MGIFKRKYKAVELPAEAYSRWEYMDLFDFYVMITSMLQSNVIEKKGAERELEKMVDTLINKPLNQKVGFYRSISDYGLRMRYKNEFLVISKNI